MVYPTSCTLVRNSKGEPCVHQNSEDAWAESIAQDRIDLVVHNAAMVGTDVAGDDIGARLRWHPETDYLGNHLLSSEKFRRASGWQPRLLFREGLRVSWESIRDREEDYDPLVHIDKAAHQGLDLVDFFPTSE